VCKIEAVQLQAGGQLAEGKLIFFFPPQLQAVDMAAVPVQVLQHTVHLLLLRHSCADAVQRCYSGLVQPAVGPGGTEQAALVISCTALQHCQQAGVRQGQQREVCYFVGHW
jgi:hypothetical protein